MWFLYVCHEEEKELGRQQAPGSCPHCGGKVEVMDVETKWKFCFLPMCFKIKRKYFCTLCARRLELFY
ncbi:Methionyl-tRNA synthetase [Quillaja saponaria]|uniref:Methionyl-tRNA synthetase n=1 Tax=Quillaja saponaria TaxID=32244 RepID=A0AAD7LD06_QUISA|nr:Methionyl-tRNA synthetase [Quillaja saponaria]